MFATFSGASSMGLNVAIQMDPIETVDINGDSSFALGLEAQRRGHALYHYLPDDLSWRQKRVTAKGRAIHLRREPGNHVSKGADETLDLAALDVILMRQDPPFDLAISPPPIFWSISTLKRWW
ncbi:hypothetical protein JCM17845_22440 [Iodidimonas gelatinilytica]|uniref:Prokaryotic glutathione synthetase N-terminal domain-containing protein n=1 Tax=Iodidimonas gelatinilytica TaxID=1236966 RepID=A0A5A7MZX3_9PROT|nr:hypothetical protein JCM17845_22440 [Iodidimonas gelatinilytica]